MVDHFSLYLGFLLAFTVIIKCESLRHESHLRYRMETLTLSEVRTTTHTPSHHSKDGEVKLIGSCALCKIIVNGLMSYVSKRYTRRSNALCAKFIHKLERKCHSIFKKLKPKIMSKLFPGRAPGVCKKFKACRK